MGLNRVPDQIVFFGEDSTMRDTKVSLPSEFFQQTSGIEAVKVDLAAASDAAFEGVEPL